MAAKGKAIQKLKRKMSAAAKAKKAGKSRL